MGWWYIVIAGLFEVLWAVGLKYSDGFTRLWPSVGTAAAMAVSFGLLSLGLRTLPLGNAYAVWVGIGALGTALAGMLLWQEPFSVMKGVSLLLVVAGIAGLKVAG